jgi:phospholipid/cholesterol/gamma-HCH transport system permease protein
MWYESFKELLQLFRQTFRRTLLRLPERKILIEQLYLTGNTSLVFISVIFGFLGLISVYQVCMQAKTVIPDFTFVGPVFIQVQIREFGPTIASLMLATKVGSGIAAEIGSMVVTDQIDALKMCNTDPLDYIVVPRFISCVIMTFVLTIYGILVATFFGMVMGMIEFNINPKTFLNLQLLEYSDVVIGVAKVLAFGSAIPVIAAHRGLNTTGGSEGVGWATTSAVVNASFAVVLLDFVISGIGYLIF